MSLSPLHRYQQDLQRPDFVEDKAQFEAVERLQALYDKLVASPSPTFSNILSRLRQRLTRTRQTPVKGLYFWGGVGRGKTYLMDIFHESLPFDHKMRVHFHRFMRRVHKELKTLKQQKNPLEIVAKRLADDARVICFDEFFVSDITDAMILASLLENLFARGVTLVATSNITPDGLYRDGLQRVRFLPAIDLLKQHTEVMNIDGGTDYRLRSLEQAELYHWPLDKAADISLKTSFNRLVPDINEVVKDASLEIEGREIMTRLHAEDVVWFTFDALCDGPRSQNDYIEIAMEYHAVILSDVPELNLEMENQTRRFINLVDEFYDRNVKLIISAARPIDKLYTGNRLKFEFERTQSRLLEMQSHEYLARAHKP